LPFEPAWLRERAARLRRQVLAEFWQEDLGTFAQAMSVEMDGSFKAARVVASSPGHLLNGRLLAGDEASAHRARLIDRFASPDLLAGAGIRTKAIDAPRFHAGSYHNGSTWPMDSGVIADGLRRWGQHRAAEDVETRVLEGCRLTGGFPEFLRGDVDGEVAVNTEIIDTVIDGVPNRLEQPPQANQGWTATRVWRILRQRGAVVFPD
jgi:glycogen debranching enzyme